MSGFLKFLAMPPKEFCEQLGLSKETEQYLEYITKKAAENEKLSGSNINHYVRLPHYLHFNLN